MSDDGGGGGGDCGGDSGGGGDYGGGSTDYGSSTTDHGGTATHFSSGIADICMSAAAEHSSSAATDHGGGGGGNSNHTDLDHHTSHSYSGGGGDDHIVDFHNHNTYDVYTDDTVYSRGNCISNNVYSGRRGNYTTNTVSGGRRGNYTSAVGTSKDQTLTYICVGIAVIVGFAVVIFIIFNVQKTNVGPYSRAKEIKLAPLPAGVIYVRDHSDQIDKDFQQINESLARWKL